ncbi:pre-mRNA-processing factor 39-like isoform X2 [Montipora capricornis]|uniref:pre-mRNA-processing factor 39-like isoform X1 n=1 Tax=Montipora capricornis TaxID=246305 RepID=UPI0035F1A406
MATTDNGVVSQTESSEYLVHPEDPVPKESGIIATEVGEDAEMVEAKQNGASPDELENSTDAALAETEVVNEQELKYWKAVKENPADFTSWTYLLQFVEQENKLSSARQAFEAFFKRYPYCYGYWKKFADMERKNGNIDRAKEVFEGAISAIPLSVDLWVHYLNFASQTTKGQIDGPELMRSLFERAVSSAGEEFRADKLWDAYIEWEKSQGQLQRVTALYDRVFKVPTQNYSQHFEKFKQHINSNPIAAVLCTEELLKLRAEVAAAPPGLTSADAEPLISVSPTSTNPPGDEDADEVAPGTETAPGTESAMTTHDDAETVAIREKVIAARQKVFNVLEEEIRKRWTFEESIKRPYFHVKPLERVQLKNWREYLDFELSNGDHRRAVILFERCVIACALYEDFWQRFASYMEGHSIEKCRHVYERACTIHLPRKPTIHLAWAAFEEEQGNAAKASEILAELDKVVPGIIMVKLKRINLERRRKNFDVVSSLYEEAINETSDQELATFFSIRYSRFLAKVMGNVDKARTTLKAALEKDKDNKRLYLQLLDLELGTYPVNEKRVEEVFELVKESESDTEIKQGFSQRRVEFLEDFSLDIASIMAAQENHAKLYKGKSALVPLTGRKRSQEGDGSDVKSKVAKSEEVVADSSQQVTSTPITGAEAYDTSYSSAAAAYSASMSAYSYAAPSQSQWAAYSSYNAAHPNAYNNYSQWYQQYGAAYGHAHQQ